MVILTAPGGEFTPTAASERARELGIDPRAVPVERFFVLFFHDQRQLFPRLISQQLDAGRRAEQWVRSELLANDYVAVVSYRYGLRLHQDFTNDADALAQAIKEAVAFNSLNSLAADTGGRYFSTFVSFLSPLEQIAETLNGYYMISYVSEVGEEAGYREVDIDTVDRTLRVRGRAGYLPGF